MKSSIMFSGDMYKFSGGVALSFWGWKNNDQAESSEKMLPA